jgi:anti-sigma factor RsiW
VTDPHVEAELLAYLDGELSAPQQARVKAHLAECERCADQLERLRALQHELSLTFDAALAPVRLPAAADRRIRDRLRAQGEPRPGWGLLRRGGLIAQAGLAALVLVFALNTFQVLGLPPPAAPPQTVVLGQDHFAPGSRAALRVVVRSADQAQPVEGAEIVVRVGRTPGLASPLFTGRTDASGSADIAFAVPADLEGQASLVVETSTTGGQDRIVRPIVIARSTKLFLTSDKPAYRPGQVVHLRGLAFDAATLRPVADQPVTFSMLDPAGRQLDQRITQPSEYGVASLDFALPLDAAYGQYTLRAALGDTLSERSVTVGAYDLPAFRVTVETDRRFYAPGERVTGSVQAAYFFGKPVPGGQVTLRGYAGPPRQTPAVVVQGRTDDAGAFKFAFVLPAAFDFPAGGQPAQVDMEVEVVDPAGQRVGIRQVLPVAAQPILVNAVPESGVLKPGVENVVYILTAYPDGQPAETALSVAVEGETRTLASGPYGLAELRYTPTKSAAPLDIRASDARGAEGHAEFVFDSDRAPQTLLLRAERAAYQVGDTLRLEALLGQACAGPCARTVYLDVVRTGQSVAALSAPVQAGRAVFALDLDSALVGTLELHAYALLPGGGLAEDTRRVIVDMPRRVAVAVRSDQGQYRPGQTAHIQVQTTLTSTGTSSGQPVQAALGIGVVDESVYALDTLPPGFARAYFLLDKQLAERRIQGASLPALLDAGATIRAAQDTAAQAAWAGTPGTGFALSAQSVAQPAAATPRSVLANRLGWLLALLPLLLSAAVVWGLKIGGILGPALRRVGLGFLLLLLLSPLVVLVVGGMMALLWVVLRVGAPLGLFLAELAASAGLAVYGWRRRDTRMQLAVGLWTAYLLLGGLLVVLAARGGDLPGTLLALIAATWLLAIAALATLGQGLALEGRRLAGWATTLLGLLLIPLAVYLPFVPGLASPLTRTVGNPALYAGPVAWLTGCASMPAATQAPAAMATREGATKEAEKIVTKEVEKAVTTAPAGPTATPAPAAVKPTQAPEATQVPAPTPPAAPAPVSTPAPREPFPLRQVFPETLYWSADARTDADGRLAFDLPLADTITTWRLTALASTRQGELGVATYDILVFQDFFASLTLPPSVGRGETITATVTLYNYSPDTQTVRLEPDPADWYSLISEPPALSLRPGDVATVTFSIRAERPGDFTLRLTAAGEQVFDVVAGDMTVTP